MPEDVIFNDHKFLYLRRINAPLPSDPKVKSFIVESAAIVYNISGCKTIMIEGTTYRIKAGDVILLKPGEAFRILNDEEQVTDYVFLFFNRSFFRPFDPDLKILHKFDDRKFGENNVVCFDEQQNTLFLSCINHMEKEMSMNDRYISLVGLLMLIITEINLSLYFKVGMDDSEARAILIYINENLSCDLGTKTLAQQFFMSESNFCRYFKGITGMSPKSYITRKRVIRARILLNLNVKIDEVMEQCGFCNYTTFYKAHAKYFNYPPSDNYARGNYDPLLLKGIPQLDMERINEALKE